MRNILIATLLLPLFATAITITNQYIIPADQQVEDEQWIIATVAQPEGIFLNDLTILCANPLFFSGTYEGNINGIAGMETALIGTAKRNESCDRRLHGVSWGSSRCTGSQSGVRFAPMRQRGVAGLKTPCRSCHANGWASVSGCRLSVEPTQIYLSTLNEKQRPHTWREQAPSHCPRPWLQPWESSSRAIVASCGSSASYESKLRRSGPV